MKLLYKQLLSSSHPFRQVATTVKYYSAVNTSSRVQWDDLYSYHSWPLVTLHMTLYYSYDYNMLLL